MSRPSVASSSYGAVTPWVMTSGSQFRPAAPPALNSEIWTRDLNEIRELGARNSTKRTAEQTTIGQFWFLTGARTYNPIVQQVAKAKDMDVVDCARLFALVSLAGADAYIAVFDAKYTYNLWRPVTAIRNADQTGNKATPREASWLPLGDTPMHPEYPCAHCIVSASVSAVLQGVVGETVGEISLTSPTAPGVTRRWTRLQDYSDEVANARIYAGFHYRFFTEVGKDMGKKIGEHWRNQDAPCREPNCTAPLIHVRFGSKADMCAAKRRCTGQCPLCADRYSITSSAVARSICGMARQGDDSGLRLPTRLVHLL